MSCSSSNKPSLGVPSDLPCPPPRPCSEQTEPCNPCAPRPYGWNSGDSCGSGCNTCGPSCSCGEQQLCGPEQPSCIVINTNTPCGQPDPVLMHAPRMNTQNSFAAFQNMPCTEKGGLIAWKDCRTYHWTPPCSGPVQYDKEKAEFCVSLPAELEKKANGSQGQNDYQEDGWIPSLDYVTKTCGCETFKAWRVKVQEVRTSDTGEPAVLNTDCETGRSRFDTLNPTKIDDVPTDKCLRMQVYEEVTETGTCGAVKKKKWYDVAPALWQYGDIKTSFNANGSGNGWKLAYGGCLDADNYPWLEGILCKIGDSFVLPDLRGQFVRFVDAGAGVDKDASDRTAQTAGCATGDEAGTFQGDSQYQTAVKYTDTRNVYTIQTEDSSVARIGTGAWVAVAEANGVPSATEHEDYIYHTFLTKTQESETKEVLARTPEEFECEIEGELEEIPFACEVRPKNVSAYPYIYVGCPDCR